VEAKGRHVEVRGNRGRLLWTKPFDALVSRAELIQLPGGAGRRILVVARVSSREMAGADAGILFAYDGAGQLQWRYGGPKTSYYLEGDMVVNGFTAVPGTDKLVVDCRNRETFFPSCLVVLDGQGKELGRYWHPGHIDHVLVAPETPQARLKIIATAVNNRERETFGGSNEKPIFALFLLDLEQVNGEAPPYTRGGPRGTHEWYGVFLPAGSGFTNFNLTAVNSEGQKQLLVWVNQTAFYFTFAGQLVRTNYGEGPRLDLEFRLIK